MDELCDMLKICQATARNWIKKGWIKAIEAQKPLRFERKEIEKLRTSIESGKLIRLSSRRNKRHKKGLKIPPHALSHTLYGPYVNELMTLLSDRQLKKSELSLVLGEHVLRLLAKRGFILPPPAKCSFAKAYREGLLPLAQVKPLIDDLLGDAVGVDTSEEFEHMLSHIQIPEICDEDFLGFLYMLLQCVGDRKAKGVYYTPLSLIKFTMDSLLSCKPQALNGNVLDPCCGTGQFILQVIHLKQNTKATQSDSDYDYEGCYGYDMDPVSIYLTRLNIVLFTGQVNLKALYEQFRIQDTLQDESEKVFDCIIGNPPWGYAFSDEELKNLVSHYTLIQGKQSESYGLFIEWALRHLNPGARLTYILPEAALTVKGHKLLRQLIHQNTDILAIDFLENAFDGVYMPAVVVHLQLKGAEEKPPHIRVFVCGQVHFIETNRYDGHGAYNFRAPDVAFRMVIAMEQRAKSRLGGQGIFALGIVTGDNKGSLYTSPGRGRVPVLAGPDVQPYTIKRPSRFVDSSKSFQQMAPMHYYQAQEKLVYRFIADRPIVAYDKDKLLTLNSCNCLIPTVENYSVKVIMAILNASPIQFYYKTRFASMKVLRGYIEALPIPLLTAGQTADIEGHCNVLLHNSSELAKQQARLQIDAIISEAFELSVEDQEYIAKTLRKKGDIYAC